MFIYIYIYRINVLEYIKYILTKLTVCPSVHLSIYVYVIIQITQVCIWYILGEINGIMLTFLAVGLSHFVLVNSRRSSVSSWSPYKKSWNTQRKFKESVRKQFNTSRWRHTVKYCPFSTLNTKLNWTVFLFVFETQAQHSERRMNEEFKKLHQFLIDEKEALITALWEEEEQKMQMMKQTLEEMNTQISALSDTIKLIEEQMKAKDATFLNVRTYHVWQIPIMWIKIHFMKKQKQRWWKVESRVHALAS